MHGFVDAQKDEVQLGFRGTARKQGELLFYEKVVNYINDLAAKYKAKTSTLTFAKLEKSLSKGKEDQAHVVNKKPQP